MRCAAGNLANNSSRFARFRSQCWYAGDIAARSGRDWRRVRPDRVSANSEDDRNGLGRCFWLQAPERLSATMTQPRGPNRPPAPAVARAGRPPQRYSIVTFWPSI